MGNEGPGLLKGLLMAFVGPDAIVGGSVADLFFEERAEGADAFKANFVADLGYGKLVSGQGFPGLFDPFAGKILVRGEPVDPGKQPVEMIPRETGLPGKTIQIDGCGEMPIDIELGRNDLFIYVGSDWHSPNFNGTLFALTRYKFSNFAPCSYKGPKGPLKQ